MHVHGILLAAGESKRFKGTKQLADIDGKAMLRQVVKQYQEAALNSFVVALGANANKINVVLDNTVNIIETKNWPLGMAHTLSEVITLAPAQTTHLLIGLGDQVALKTNHLNSLINAAQISKTKIVTARYLHTLGAPVVFPVYYIDALKQLQGDKGAKQLIRNNIDNTVAIDIPDAAIDIDTQDDLQHWLNALHDAH